MRKLTQFLVLVASLSLKSFAQNNVSNQPPINLNQQILTILDRGDSSMRTNNFLLAEKYFIEACQYTDTLIFLVSGHRSLHYSFTRKKIQHYVHAYEKLAQLYQMAGNLKKSDELFTKAIKQKQILFSERSVYRISPYLGLGQLYFQAEDFDKALVYFNQGGQLLDRASTTNFNYDVLRYQLYGFQFETYLKKGKTNEALRFLHRYFYALNTIHPTNEQIATAFEMKARYYLQTGNTVQTDYYLHRAENFIPKNYVTFSIAEVRFLRTKSLYHWYHHHYDSALSTFEKLLHVYKTNIEKHFSALSEYEREQFYVTLKKDFDLFNSFVADFMHAGRASPAMMTLLYNTQLFTKALLLNEITKLKRVIDGSHDPELMANVVTWQNLKEQVAKLYYTDRKASTAISQLGEQINTIEKEINQKTTFLTKIGKDVQWQQIQNHLKEKEAAVEIIRTKKFYIDSIQQKGIQFSNEVQYIALSIQSKSLAPDGFILPESAGLETKYIFNYRNCILQQLPDTLSYNLYWKPILNHLPQCNTFFLSSDGVYNQLNPNVLQNPVTGKYVLDELTVLSVTNTKDILQSAEGTTMQTASLFGRPDYSGNITSKSEKHMANNSLRALGDREMLNFTDQEFIDLPGTETEVESIKDILNSKQWQVQIFLNANATEDNIKTLQSPSVLHIATHGFFLEDDGRHINSMIRSGVLLSGIKNRSGQEAQDGILTAYEATNLTLENTNLVVLSACETGLGEIKNGEGVYGLQRGLKVAGAKNLLMSFWKVDDRATADLMINFYKNWVNGQPIHNAFKKAQLELRKEYQSPFYWGAFILIGN
ncbi:MAG: CHAT domain-containing protein [Cyclobacteriaceae bacterium]|nr:CHAT domain-containing protein [Cyclobacteriaceae bacterium]